MTLSGLNTAATFADIYNSRNQLLTYGISDATLMAIRPLIEVPENYYSLAARSRARDLVSFITDQQHYTLSKSTGEMTAFSLSGVDMDEAFYQYYGQDGLLYVLDYGNDRIASFDPDSAFAPVSSFSLNTGVTTANVQFAIGITGSVYLADGLGGGSYYDSTGAFQGTFSLPGGTVGAPYEGASYVSTDSAGRVYIFDSATGFHQYDDVAVPEPGTALAGLALIGLVGAARRRRAF